MALLASKRRIEEPRPSLTKSVDAALGIFGGSRRASSEFAQDVMLAIGQLAETLDAPTEVRREIALSIASFADRASLPASEVVDRLLDVRVRVVRCEA
jgi:hypothetical protein